MMEYKKILDALFNKKQANIIITHFPTVLRLVDDGAVMLRETQGCSQKTYHRVNAARELIRSYDICKAKIKLKRVRSPQDVATLLSPEMKDLDREYFKVILLNTKNSILCIETIAIGSLNAAIVHPREIFKIACLHSAAGIIIVHNHPSGNPDPSREDADLTCRFAKCGELMGIDLIDHVIIGGDSFVSMREKGMLDRELDDVE